MRAGNLSLTLLFFSLCGYGQAAGTAEFEGRYFRGQGDVAFLQMLNTARAMFEPDPQLPSVLMLYDPSRDGLVDGLQWPAWWISRSYGTSYAGTPFITEPLRSFVRNSQNLWFEQMGSGQRADAKGDVAPDGSLCDFAAPGKVVYKQADGQPELHDWPVEFTAAGVVLQAESLLASRDMGAVRRYLPLLERCADFIETRRDSRNNLFLAGAGANLLAPGWAGSKQKDGTFGKAYLTGISINYIAALDRLIELEKLAGRPEQAEKYSRRREQARQGLPLLLTEEGYFVNSVDPDGLRHGVYGAEQHGYFASAPNQDAIAFRVVSDEQAEKIYSVLASIPGLRRHGLMIANQPGLDDYYSAEKVGLRWSEWNFGTWVNGGSWATCEARMILGYYRLGKFEDIRRSMGQFLNFATRFELDQPFSNFGSTIDFASQLYPGRGRSAAYVTYGAFGIPAAAVRGLFEYLYSSEALELVPHVPPSVTRLEQRFPIQWGGKSLFLSTEGAGPIREVRINGQKWPSFNQKSIHLPFVETPQIARVLISLGDRVETDSGTQSPLETEALSVLSPPSDDAYWDQAIPKVEDLLRKRSANRIPLRIGADHNGNNRFMGQLAGIRIFSRAVSEEGIHTLRESTNAQSDPTLVANWIFDKSTRAGFPDLSANRLDATAVGDLRTIESEKGAVLQFAARGWLEVGYDPKLNLPQAFTLDLWINPAVVSRDTQVATLLDRRIPGDWRSGWALDLLDGERLRLITDEASVLSDKSLPVGRWSHVAATFETGQEMRLYIDGTPVDRERCKVLPPTPELGRFRRLYTRIAENNLAATYEGKSLKTILEQVRAIEERARFLWEVKSAQPLSEPQQSASDQLMIQTLLRLCEGFVTHISKFSKSEDPNEKKMHAFWVDSLKAWALPAQRLPAPPSRRSAPQSQIEAQSSGKAGQP